MKEYFVGQDDFKRAHRVVAMISANALRRRKDNRLPVSRWMLDSGAFSQITQYGDFIMSPKDYVAMAVKFQNNGNLACIVAQDYMCEPSVIHQLNRKGVNASVRIHQRKTVDRYIQIMDEAGRQGLRVPVMPVLQGWEMEDYVQHYRMYKETLEDLYEKRGGFYARLYRRREFGNNKLSPVWRGEGVYGSKQHIDFGPGLWLNPFTDRPGVMFRSTTGKPTTRIPINMGQWLGLGSTCKRNSNPEAVDEILNHLEAELPAPITQYKLHAFGLKKTALGVGNIRDRLYSADSFAYDFGDRITGKCRTREQRSESAMRFGGQIENMPVQLGFSFNNGNNR